MMAAARFPRTRSFAAPALVAALAVTGLTGCGDKASSTTPKPTTAASAPSAAGLSVQDPWVKATDGGMTAAFGTLVNTGGVDVTVRSASSPTSPIELHTLVDKDGKQVMQPASGGFVVKAYTSYPLAPGRDHLMLMKPVSAIKPGDEVAFTLDLSNGQKVRYTAVAKPFVGAGESYAPGQGTPGAHS